MPCQNLLHSIAVILLTITVYGLLGCSETKDPMSVTPSENGATEGAAILSGRVIDLEKRPAKIVFANGTPLANEEVRIHLTYSPR